MLSNFKQSFLIFICFLALSFNFSCTSIKKLNYTVTTKKHEPAQLINDVDFAHNLLKNGHPGIYWYIDKKQLDFKFDSLKQTLTAPLSTKEFYKKLAPVIAEVKCGHTRLILVTKKLTKNEKDSIAKWIKPVRQFAYKVIDNKLYITSLNKNIKDVKKGDEILAIDGVSSADIINNLIRNYASDGYNKTFKIAVLNRAFANWYTTIYEEKDELDFRIKGSDSVFNIRLKTIFKEAKKDTVTRIKSNANTPVLTNQKLRYKGSDELKKPLLDLNFVTKDKSIAYLKVKSFSFPYANFDRFFRESFEAIKKANTKNLILDLRDNGGGSITACRNLFSYLVDKDFILLNKPEVNVRFNPYKNAKGFGNVMKSIGFYFTTSMVLKKEENGNYKLGYKAMQLTHPNKNHYDGKIYVLINGYSFSASSILASSLKEINRATFVGQETGGGYNACVAGKIPVIDLPYSKLKLRMGLYPLVPNAYSTTYGRGVFPDKEVLPTIEDVLAGKDRELEWVMNDIRTKKE